MPWPKLFTPFPLHSDSTLVLWSCRMEVEWKRSENEVKSFGWSMSVVGHRITGMCSPLRCPVFVRYGIHYILANATSEAFYAGGILQAGRWSNVDRMAASTSTATGPTIDWASDNLTTSSGSATNTYIRSPVKANISLLIAIRNYGRP